MSTGPREIITPTDPRARAMVLEAGEAKRRAKERCVCVLPCSMVSKLVGNTGRSLALASGTSGDLLNLSAPDECAAAITVTITLENAAGSGRQGTARLQWGTGGHLADADVDCSRGTMVSLFASSLRVTVTNDSTGSAVAGAFIGHGAGVPTAPVRSVRYQNADFSGSSLTQAIPQFAKFCHVYRTQPQNSVRVNFSGNGAWLVYVAPFDQPRLIVPGAAINAQVVKEDPDDTGDVNLVYELVL